MKATQTTHTEVSVWNRLIRPDRGDMSPETAKFFLQLEFDPDDLKRMHHLAVKNQEGALSRAEEEELREYRHIGLQLALLHAKARLSLQQPRNGR